MNELVVITGAGISKASGIPTFAEMGDLRDKLSRSYYNKHPEDFYKTLLEMKKSINGAEPNAAHFALAKYNIPVITMNIDGLHTRAGSKNVMEVHGNLDSVFCLKCKTKEDFNIVEKSIYCDKCGKIYESNVVLYGDNIRFFYDALELVGNSKQVLVVGTSFYTSTVNEFVAHAKRLGIKVDVINQDAENEVEKYLERCMV